MRGWMKELLVIFSVIVALSFIAVIENLLPVIGPFLKENPTIQYWVRIIIVLTLVFFGYQSPRFSRFSKSVEKRERIGDTLLGLFMGLISGYFVIGTLWSFSHSANYPLLADYINWEATPPDILEMTQRVLSILPPVWLGQPPIIYIAVVLAFVFVIIVFV
jgi:H+/Cl- antiporter ClcA